jgi:hypothetical protein
VHTYPPTVRARDSLRTGGVRGSCPPETSKSKKNSPLVLTVKSAKVAAQLEANLIRQSGQHTRSQSSAFLAPDVKISIARAAVHAHQLQERLLTSVATLLDVSKAATPCLVSTADECVSRLSTEALLTRVIKFRQRSRDFLVSEAWLIIFPGKREFFFELFEFSPQNWVTRLFSGQRLRDCTLLGGLF